MGCCGTKKDFCVGAGATFAPVIRLGSNTLTSVPISDIAQSTPALVSATNHGAPDGWPVAVVDCVGMIQINATRYPPVTNDLHPATVMSADAVALNDVSSALFQPYVSGGALVYHTPVDLTGATATMTFWDNPEKEGTPLLTLVSGAQITIDTVNFTMIPILQTVGLPWTLGYYDYDFTNASGEITRILEGTLTIN